MLHKVVTETHLVLDIPKVQFKKTVSNTVKVLYIYNCFNVIYFIFYRSIFHKCVYIYIFVEFVDFICILNILKDGGRYCHSCLSLIF